MNSSLLSIIIPAYNTGKHLSKVLNILLSQSYDNIEIIVVNDASTDNTKSIVENFGSQTKKIRYYENSTNLGVGSARNLGISIASGEFVTFLDSDDWPDLFVYENAIKRMNESSECDVVIWGIKNEYNNVKSSAIRTDYQNVSSINKNVALALLSNALSVDVTISSYLGSKMFRKSLLDQNEILFGNYYYEDVEFSIKTLLYANKILLLPNLYTHYYQRENSIVHSFSQKHIEDTFAMLSNLRKDVKEKLDNHFYNSLIEKCSKNVFRFMFSCVHDPIIQRKYICDYLNKLTNFVSIEQIINYLDIDRLRNILLNF